MADSLLSIDPHQCLVSLYSVAVIRSPFWSIPANNPVFGWKIWVSRDGLVAYDFITITKCCGPSWLSIISNSRGEERIFLSRSHFSSGEVVYLYPSSRDSVSLDGSLIQFWPCFHCLFSQYYYRRACKLMLNRVCSDNFCLRYFCPLLFVWGILFCPDRGCLTYVLSAVLKKFVCSVRNVEGNM